METSVASVVFHERITLSPGLMLFGVAVMVAVGAVPLSAEGGGGGGGGACFLPHPTNAAIARTARQVVARRRMFQVRAGSGFTVFFSSSRTVLRPVEQAADTRYSVKNHPANRQGLQNMQPS
jgi:hypothetical protein